MEPDWLKKARAEGRITEKGINHDALLPTHASPAIVPGYFDGASEAEFQKFVIDFAKARGWKVAHFRKVRVQRKGGEVYWETPVAADGKGFLDLELVRERIVKVELKVPPNTTTVEQKTWIDAYLKAGVEVYVWYPCDMLTIAETLKVLA